MEKVLKRKKNYELKCELDMDNVDGLVIKINMWVGILMDFMVFMDTVV